MSITEYRLAYKPFEYPKYFEYFKKTIGSVWRPEEVSMDADVRDWQYNTSQEERDVIQGILRGFTQLECYVGCHWADRVCKIFPKHEIVAMARAFSTWEGIHAQAYNYLSDTLGLNEFEAFLGDPIARKKIDYFLNETSEKVSLAIFSGAGEGVSLFSSFAVLLSFNLSGRFKGLGQIISWSVLDEACVDGETEYLTPTGWKKIKDYSNGDKIAQFNPETKEINFVLPTKYIQKKSDKMYRIGKNNRWSQYVTPDHTIIDYKNNEVRKSVASEWSGRQSYLPVAGILSSAPELTALDRFMIALQADGSIRKDGSKREVNFSFKRKRKINRFRDLAKELVSDYGFKVRETFYEDYGYTNFSLLVPDQYLPYRSKFFDEVYNFDSVPKGFLQELAHWDGHIAPNSTSIYYSSKEIRNIEFVQTVASLSGYYGHISSQVDYRWSEPKTQFRINLKKQNVINARNSYKNLENLDSEVDVYCFKVEHKAFLTRRDGLISVTGNCHSDAGCELFRDLVSEQGITSEELEQIWQGFNAIVENEFSFIDNIFNNGKIEIEGVTQENLKSYILSRANNRLKALGIEDKRFDVDNEKAEKIRSWFDPLVKGQSSTDFFAMSKDGFSYVAKPLQNYEKIDYKSINLELI